MAHSDPSGSGAGAKSGQLAQTTTQPAATQSSVCLSVWLTVCLSVSACTRPAARPEEGTGLDCLAPSGEATYGATFPPQRGKSGLPRRLFMTYNALAAVTDDWWFPNEGPDDPGQLPLLPCFPFNLPKPPTRLLQPCTSVYLFTWCPVEQSRWGITFWSFICKFLVSC